MPRRFAIVGFTLLVVHCNQRDDSRSGPVYAHPGPEFKVTPDEDPTVRDHDKPDPRPWLSAQSSGSPPSSSSSRTSSTVRGAQLGNASMVPARFHPVMDGGAIHERRHSLTWILSPGIDWDDTDMST